MSFDLLINNHIGKISEYKIIFVPLWRIFSHYWVAIKNLYSQQLFLLYCILWGNNGY